MPIGAGDLTNQQLFFLLPDQSTAPTWVYSRSPINRRSSGARLCKFDLAAFDAASAATKLEFGGTAEEEGEDLIIS